MTGGDIITEAITNSSTESLLPSRVPYACSLSRTNDVLRSFRFFPLPPLGHLRPHYHAYDVVVQSPSPTTPMTWWSSSLTSAFDL
ncbi:unnamed protein product, partial [Musa acuminata subsp. burmannicoides]